MKYILSLSLIILFCDYGLSQNFSVYKDFKFARPEQYREQEQMALEASKFILSTKHTQENTERLYAIQFMMKWMEGTPDHNLEIKPWLAGIMKTDQFLYPVGLAALTRVALDEKLGKPEGDKFQLEAANLIADYVGTKEYSIRARSTVKKFMQAKEEGKLKEFIEN
ncbi:MAG: hypothetical protein JJU28_19760 [Cyclobacteriaceae bacterium]|nr:hypothetical protein [Cyclobacteriaceae bacterium]